MITRIVRVALVLGVCARPAIGQTTYTDDLTDGVFDAPFNYDFGGSTDFADWCCGGSYFEDFHWLFADFGGGLLFNPEVVTITFPGVSEPIQSASVQWLSCCLDDEGIETEFIGTLGSIVWPDGPAQFQDVDQSDGIGTITAIRIRAIEHILGSVSITTAPAPGCAGDINGDGATNVADFNILASNFGDGPGATHADGDLTGDGFVNVGDFNSVAGDFGCPN